VTSIFSSATIQFLAGKKAVIPNGIKNPYKALRREIFSACGHNELRAKCHIG